MVMQDEELKGVKIGDYTHKIAQFADDTAAYLKNWQQLPRLFELARRWEATTAMSANKSKTALIPMGSLKGSQPPEEMREELDIPGASEEPYEIYLGVPVAADRSAYAQFPTHKYRRIKVKLTQWTSIRTLTHKGRAMIADSLVYSRMRYWAQCMAIPPRINEWIEGDVQAMIWNKEPVFQQDEDGTRVENKRFMLKGAQYNDKVSLGLGLINWRDHVRAIQVKALLDYRDGNRSDYKKILDEWIVPNYGHARRGAIFYNIKDKAKSMKLEGTDTPLPRFWKEMVASSSQLLGVDDKWFAC